MQKHPPLLAIVCAGEKPAVCAGKSPEVFAGERLAFCDRKNSDEDPPENSLILPENMVFKSILRPHPPAVELGKGGVLVALSEVAGSCAAPRAQGARNMVAEVIKSRQARNSGEGRSKSVV